MFAVLWIMSQGQPLINIFLFFANTRVIMKLFPTFPTFTAVLSSPTTTQFSQSNLLSLRMESMLLKSASVVPSLHVPISKGWAETFTLLSPNKRVKTGFNFLCLICHLIHHLRGELRSKDNIIFRNNYKAIIRETFTLRIYFKGRNSANSWIRENELNPA